MNYAEFGDFKYDFERRLLSRSSRPVSLGLRATALLECLLARRGSVVTKADLIGATWGDDIVEESNLSVQVATIRKAIGKDEFGRDWISTVERIGYRFLPAPAPTAPAKGRELPSLVVVLEGTDDAPWATDGACALVAALARFSWLAIRPIDAFSEPHDYRVLLRPSASNEPLMRLGLVDVGAQRVVWSGELDASKSEAPLPPSARAAALIEASVHACEIRRATPANGRSPYDLYIRARALLRQSRPDQNARALALMQEALEYEPTNSMFLCAAAEVLLTRVQIGWPELTGHDRELRTELTRRAWAAAEHDAVALSLAGHSLFTCGEPDLGMTLTEAAAEINPISPLVLTCAGHSHMFIGDLEIARSYYQRAIELGPTDPATRFAYASLASLQNLAGTPELAHATARRGLAIAPDVAFLQWHLMVASRQMNRMDEARRHFARYQSVHAGTTLESIRAGRSFADPRRAAMVSETLLELGLPAR